MTAKDRYPFVVDTEDGVYMNVRIQPGVSRQGINLNGGVLRISLKSPPHRGRANRELVEFLSDLFGVKKTSISITYGTGSKNKRIRIEGITRDEIEDTLSSLGM